MCKRKCNSTQISMTQLPQMSVPSSTYSFKALKFQTLSILQSATKHHQRQPAFSDDNSQTHKKTISGTTLLYLRRPCGPAPPSRQAPADDPQTQPQSTCTFGIAKRDPQVPPRKCGFRTRISQNSLFRIPPRKCGFRTRISQNSLFRIPLRKRGFPHADLERPHNTPALCQLDACACVLHLHRATCLQCVSCHNTAAS